MAPTAATPIMKELRHTQFTKPELPSTPRRSGSAGKPRHTPRYGTLEEMAATRKKSQAPHPSYALVKPPHDMSQRDFFLARKFDQDSKGFLTSDEQSAAKNALHGGFGKDHYSDYMAHKPQTRFQKILSSTLPFAPTTLSDTFNRCFTEFEDRHDPTTGGEGNMTRTKLLRERTLAEEEVLAAKIQNGWVQSVDRLRPKTTGKKKPAHRHPAVREEGYVDNPKHKSRQEVLESRQSKRKPKVGYEWDETEGVGPREYFIASLFDEGQKLDLTNAERMKMDDAIAGGLGGDSMQTYFSHRNPPPDTRVARVLRRTFKVDARRLEDSFNRTIGNECGGFEVRNDEAGWVTTTQETIDSHADGNAIMASPLRAWRQAGKPDQQQKKQRVITASPRHHGTDAFGEVIDHAHPGAASPGAEILRPVSPGAHAVTDRTHQRPRFREMRQARPPVSSRPSTSEGMRMRERYDEWSSLQGRPASQGRSAGLALDRNKGQGALNMFLPMPPRRH